MKAATEPTLTLEAVAEHFAQWRIRKRKRERIPETLWQEAIDLLDRYRISHVTRTLRLSGSDLNRRRGVSAGGRCRKRAVVNQKDTGATFVEVTDQAAFQTAGPNATAGWLALHRPDSMRLHIHPSDRRELLALVDRFMGG